MAGPWEAYQAPAPTPAEKQPDIAIRGELKPQSGPWDTYKAAGPWADYQGGPEAAAVAEANRPGFTGPPRPPVASAVPSAVQPADIAAGGAVGALEGGLGTAARVAGEFGLQAKAHDVARPYIEEALPGHPWLQYAAETVAGVAPIVAGHLIAGGLRAPSAEPVRPPAPAPETAPISRPVSEAEQAIIDRTRATAPSSEIQPPVAVLGPIEGGEIPSPPKPVPPSVPPPPEPVAGLSPTDIRQLKRQGYSPELIAQIDAKAKEAGKPQEPRTPPGAAPAPSEPTIVESAPPPAQPPGAAAPPPSEPPPELPKYAGSINLQRLNTSDDVKQAILEMSSQIRRSESVPLAEQQAQGAARGTTAEEATRIAAAGPDLRAQSMATRMLLANAADDFVAKRAAGGAELADTWKRLQTIQEAADALAREEGRRLGARRVMIGPGELRARTIKEMLTRGANPEDLREIADQVATLNPEQLQGYLRATRGRETSKFFWAWLNGLLSNPVTYTVKTTSDLLSNITNIVDTALAGGLGKLHGGDKVYLREAAVQAVNSVTGVEDALEAAWNTIRTGQERFGGGMVEAQPIKGFTGNVIGAPVRVLKTINEFWQSIAYRQQLHALAWREALSKGGGAEAVANILKNPPEAMVDAAIERAKYVTQTRALGKAGRLASQLVEAIPGMHYLAPFRRVPVNLVKFAAEHSIFAPMMSEVRQQLVAGGAQRDLALARMATGTAVAAWAASKAAKGLITGAGPTEPGQKAVWMRDHQPYSIKVGDKWVSYERLEPIGFLLGTAADFVETYQRVAPDQTADEVAARLAMSVTKNITSKTYLETLSQLQQAFSNPEGPATKLLVQTLASSVIPRGVRQYAKAEDDFQRETRTVLDAVTAGIPGQRETLPIRQDVFGEQVRNEGAVGGAMISPLYQRSATPDPVADELTRLGMGIGRAPRKLEGAELTPEQTSHLRSVGGTLRRRLLERVMATEWYRNASDDARRYVLGDVIKQGGQVGKLSTIASDKQLQASIRDVLTKKRQRLTSPAPTP